MHRSNRFYFLIKYWHKSFLIFDQLFKFCEYRDSGVNKKILTQTPPPRSKRPKFSPLQIYI